MAVALALLAVIGAGLWFRSRALSLRELTMTRDDLCVQMAGAQSYSGLNADYEKRLEMMERDIKAITRKFAGKDYESPQLVKAVVKSASIAGLEMISASKQDRKTDALPVRGREQKASFITHEIKLKGAYTGLVKFMQSLMDWDLGYRMESIEIVPAGEGVQEGEIEATIILSVFSLELLDATK
ncbi:MAG: hypothetical protein KKG09_11085 [Verrucomicrobia bacterium]|nr:hypothetical protein [Verrucomicrobiota bacterium]MBU4248657.1 hypothetical protein [Verrucomicrobiota bacterium]MBU4289972.1 hypothetical protein [Verrucomicrobiota bacterium]MBU4498537.1 hypothetical protein [Verrucomicrobiota bacterium]MCG2679536.1 hypothetical protein [Kiritimatiellia bacterium]